jgi:hypothetical protein
VPYLESFNRERVRPGQHRPLSSSPLDKTVKLGRAWDGTLDRFEAALLAST